jgi:cytochrome c oxidase assembly protein subunit 11
MTRQTAGEASKRRTLLLLTGLAVGMFGFGFALVPLYGLLCKVTGVQSLEQRTAIGVGGAAAAGTVVNQDRWVTVKLDATVNPDLPWTLGPSERKVRVRPGEVRQVTFIAENRSGREITGQAIPNIAPFQATGFFSKMECFCFTRQTLAGNERREMPLQFSVSPDLPAGIDSMTLSYNVLRVSEPGPLAASR